MGSTWLPKSLRSDLGSEMDQEHICGSYNALPLKAKKFKQQTLRDKLRLVARCHVLNFWPHEFQTQDTCMTLLASLHCHNT